jgi:hypothetical protein
VVNHKRLSDNAGRLRPYVSFEQAQCEINAGRHSRGGPNRAIGNEDPVYLHLDLRKAVLQLTAIEPMGRRTTTIKKAGLGERKCSDTNRCYSPR